MVVMIVMLMMMMMMMMMVMMMMLRVILVELMRLMVISKAKCGREDGAMQEGQHNLHFLKTAMEVDPMKSEKNMSKKKDACKLIELHLTNS